jgi:hypothetical protein
MKKLIAIAVTVITVLTTAQVQAQTSASFKKQITEFADSTIKAANPGLTKTERFDCKQYVMVKKFGAQDGEYDITKAHFNNIIEFCKDEEKKEQYDIEKLPADFVKELCKNEILAKIEKNKNDGYDAYDFEVVEVNGKVFLVLALGFVNPIDTQEEIDEMKKNILGEE